MTWKESGRLMLFALVALPLGCGIFSACKERIYLSQAEIGARIKKELPLGSSTEQVNAFVDSYSSRFETHVSDYKESVPEPPDLDAPDEKLSQAQGYIVAGIRRTGTAPQYFATWNIRLTFYFDKNRTLAGYQLKTFGTH